MNKAISVQESLESIVEKAKYVDTNKSMSAVLSWITLHAIDALKAHKDYVESARHELERAERERDVYRNIDMERQSAYWMDRALEAESKRDALLDALDPFADARVDTEHGACHSDICSAEECGRCGPILRARAAIASVRR